MKKLLVVFVALIVFISCTSIAFADNNIALPDRTSTELLESPCQPLTDQPIPETRASATKYLTSYAWTKVYSCPVRKKHVTVTWTNSAGPISVTIRVTFKNSNNAWEDVGYSTILTNHSCVFDLPYAAYYNVYATVVTGDEGNCTFSISATA